jgi:hypothetical protein
MWGFALVSCCHIPDIFLTNSLSVLSQQFSDLNLSSALAVKYQRLDPKALRLGGGGTGHLKEAKLAVVVMCNIYV